jgi:hypothetical protein
MPVRPSDNYYKSVYPNAINKPWYFTDNGYQFDQNLRTGQGYLIKFSDSVDKIFNGSFIRRISPEDPNDKNDDMFNDSVQVYKDSWAMIGALSQAMNVKDINFTPFGNETQIPNIDFTLSKGVWGYLTDQGYKEVSELDPGLGYWIKTDLAGYLKLVSPQLGRSIVSIDPANAKQEALDLSTQIQIRDNGQHQKSLYLSSNQKLDVNNFELPPAPYFEAFDARFVKNTYLDNSSNPVIALQGITPPVSITLQNQDASYSFLDAATGKLYGTIEKGSGNYIDIPVAANMIKIIKTETQTVTGFEFTCTPNPVSSKANIVYSVPESNNVTIKLFDALGNDVQTIVDGSCSAGLNNAILNADGLSSGTYICRIISGKYTSTQTINVVK